MSEQAKSPHNTVRRWRRVFIGIYVAFTAGAVLLTFFSVLAVHCGSNRPLVRGRRISVRADRPTELRDCQRKLKDLATDLHRETFLLQSRALRFKMDPGVEWRNWSQVWRHRWSKLDWRCRFGELSGQGVSAEIDKMATIHRSLDELQLSYSGVVNNFVERYVDRLRTLREELAKVRVMIDRRKPGVQPGRPQSHGATR